MAYIRINFLKQDRTVLYIVILDTSKLLNGNKINKSERHLILLHFVMCINNINNTTTYLTPSNIIDPVRLTFNKTITHYMWSR